MMNKINSFIIHEDYRIFHYTKTKKDCNKELKKVLYLTYVGLLRVFFVSRSINN